MLEVTEVEIKKRLAFDNPWWEEGEVHKRFREWPRRAHFDGFYGLFKESTVQRAVVLMGPRRVGKTVMLTQAVQQLIDDKIEAKRIFYVSVDTPTYIGLSLEKLLRLFMEIHGHKRDAQLFVMFDEVQYLKDWEQHLKSLVDSFPSIRFVASGSAAAALKMKSQESGAGRFTDFLLPPLSFAEFLRFTGRIESIFDVGGDRKLGLPRVRDIDALNASFLDYTNYGGFPEAVIDENVRNAMDRFIANDVIDKVLLRDLPSLYGIADTQELKRLFTYLAYNTGAEVSFENLSNESGIAKNTIKKYLDYLEAAFLIRRLHRIDQNARRFKRITQFKVYLTNVSIRAALFGPTSEIDDLPGLVAETAVISQIAQSALMSLAHYARWKSGEVDLVMVDKKKQSSPYATELKWSNRAVEHPRTELRSLISFCKRNDLTQAAVTTKNQYASIVIDGIDIQFRPTSDVCYSTGADIVEGALARGVDPHSLRRLS